MKKIEIDELSRQEAEAFVRRCAKALDGSICEQDILSAAEKVAANMAKARASLKSPPRVPRS